MSSAVAALLVLFVVGLIVAQGEGDAPAATTAGRLSHAAPTTVVASTPARGAGPVARRFGSQPLLFEPVEDPRGAADVFVTRAPGYTAQLSAREVRFAMMPPSPKMPPPPSFRMVLQDAAPDARARGEQLQQSRSHYFSGDDPAAWRSGVANYAQVRYEQVYAGVDLLYHGVQGQLKYDFIVAPGTDPRVIRLSFPEADRLAVSDEGDLLVHVGEHTFRHEAPYAYQEAPDGRRVVDSRYVVEGRTVRFGLVAHDATLPLVIDPVLVFSTYLGGNIEDWAYDVAVDPAGYVYVTGQTRSITFPTENPIQDELIDGPINDVDAFVAKFTPDGSSLVYATYLGGRGGENFQSLTRSGIAVDAAGSAYVTGYTTSTDFPVTTNAFSRVGDGTGNAFVTKISPDGASLVYSTYLGGPSGSDGGRAIAVDATGHAYVTGFTNARDFPTTTGALQEIMQAGSYAAFVTKLDPSGSLLAYSTFLGGNTGQQRGNEIEVDSTGHAYVAGQANASNFPTTQGAFQRTFGGGFDGWVAKLEPDGRGLVWSTYLGGETYDYANGLAVRPDSSVFVTGRTESSDFPVTPTAFQPGLIGRGDAFVVHLTADGGGLVYSTLLGGSVPNDVGYDVAVDTAGHAVVVGSTSSADFPLVDELQRQRGGFRSAFITKVNAAGDGLYFSTYISSQSDSDGFAVATDSSGNVYVAGTATTGLPTTDDAFQAAVGGYNDAFVMKVTGLPPVPSFSPADVTLAAYDYLGALWGDFDGDGDPDLLIDGTARSGAVSTYHLDAYDNDGGSLTLGPDRGLGPSVQGAMAWTDAEGDGDLDLLATGRATPDTLLGRLFVQDAGSFIEHAAQLPALIVSDAVWGDVDNDGDPDLAISGQGPGGGPASLVTDVYLNDGSGLLTPMRAGLPRVGYSALAWGDYDGDGDLDLALSGVDTTGSPLTQLYRNEGGMLQEHEVGLADVWAGALAWGDYDGDGDLDLVAAGQVTSTTASTRLYRNDGGTFTDVQAGLQGLAVGEASWGDYDNDGDLDLLMNGGDGVAVPHTLLYDNDGGTLAPASVMLTPVGAGVSDWVDYDVDGDLDLFVGGRSTSPLHVVALYRNNAAAANTPPETPAGLQATMDGNTVVFSWDAARDDETPTPALTYALRVGTRSGAGDVMPALALPDGTRRVGGMGNVQHNTEWRLHLPPGTYYWSVQAVDGGYAGSPFATMQQVSVTTATEDEGALPGNYELEAGYPNPFRTTAHLRYALPTAAHVTLRLYDALGRVRAVLVDGQRPAGWHTLRVDAGELPSGTYFARLEAGTFQATQELVVVR